MIFFLNLLAQDYTISRICSRICLVVAIVLSLFVLIVVLIQQGNSEGVSALGGQSDTFYGKNKSKTMEHKLKILTGICIAIIAILMIVYFILE